MRASSTIRTVAVAAGLLAGASARAESWREHGVFHVESGIARGSAYCQLKAETAIDGSLISLSLRWDARDRLRVSFYVSEPPIDDTEQVTIALDDTRVLRFAPIPTPEGSGRHPAASASLSPVVGLVVERLLHGASADTEWLKVGTDIYEEAIPANGLGNAMVDLDECRKSMRQYVAAR